MSPHRLQVPFLSFDSPARQAMTSKTCGMQHITHIKKLRGPGSSSKA